MGRRRYRSEEPDAVSEFFELLVQVAGAAPLIGCIYIPPGSSYEWRNRASQKHVDFVLCDPADLRPRLVIELDDKSHDQPERIERDRFVDEALACAEIPVLHVRAAVAYDVQELAERVARAMK